MWDYVGILGVRMPGRWFEVKAVSGIYDMVWPSWLNEDASENVVQNINYLVSSHSQ